MRSVIYAGLCVLATAPVPAEAQVAPRQALRLPAQALGVSLRALATAFGRNVSAPAELVAGHAAPAIDGLYSFDEALAAVLAGSGLRADPAGGGVAIARDLRGGVGAETADTGTQDIVVTGTQIRGGASASNVITARRDEIRNAGQATLGEFAQSLPQSFGGGQNPGVGFNVPASGGANVGGGASFNLRGLGSDATLTLLDGRRLPYSASAQSIDVSAIPLAAVERVEIMPDGASALYGSDAVAGVVNIILRRRFDGVETNARLGGSTDGGNFRQLYGGLAGAEWRGGGLLAAYEYERDTAITADQRDYGAARPGLTFYPALRSHRAIASIRHALTADVELSVTGLYNNRSSGLSYPLNAAGDLAVSHAVQSFSVRSYALAPVLAWTPGNWRIALSGTLGADTTAFRGDSYAGTALASSLAGRYRNRSRAIELGGDGALFALPGGTARLAIGAGGRWNDFTLFRGPGATQNIDASRDNVFAYGELSLPILGAGQAIPLLRSLTATAALRYEHYRGIGDVATPKLGLIYAPSADIDVKASWGRSFRAPTFIQQYQVRQALLYPAAIFTGVSYPPGSNVLLLVGGNRGLAPERATSWSLSLAFHPRAAPGLSVELGYFSTRYRDRIVNPIPRLARALADPLYRDQVTADPSTARQAAVLAGADQFINATGGAYDPTRVVAIVNSANVNAGQQRLHGIDALLGYRTALGDGPSTLFASLNASYLVSDQQLTLRQPVQPLAGILFNPPHFRGRATLGWESDGAMVSATLSRIGGVKDTRSVPAARIAGMTMIDLSARRRIARSGPLANLDVTLAAQNLFNAKPAPIATTLYYDTPYDSTNYSPFGRVLSIGISKKW